MADVDVNVRARGAKQAAADIDRTSRATRGLGRSARRLGLPLLGAGLLTGFLGGSLLSLAANSGAGANAVLRLQSTLEQLFDTLLRPFEPYLISLAEFIDENGRLVSNLALGVAGFFAVRFAISLARVAVEAFVAVLRGARWLFLLLAPLGLKLLVIAAALLLLAGIVYLVWRNWDGLIAAVRGAPDAIIDWARRQSRGAIDLLNGIVDTINRIVRRIYTLEFIPTVTGSRSGPLGIPIPEVGLRSLGGTTPQIPSIPTPSYLQSQGAGGAPSGRDGNGGTVNLTVNALDTESVQAAMQRAADDPQFRRTFFGIDL